MSQSSNAATISGQKTISREQLLALKKEIPAFNMAETATPDSTIEVPWVLPPPRKDMPITIAVAHSAPAKAASGNAIQALGARHKISMTNSPAPELTPIILGAHRLLSVTHCNTEPAMASAAPARAAPAVLGRRRSITIIL